MEPLNADEVVDEEVVLVRVAVEEPQLQLAMQMLGVVVEGVLVHVEEV